MQCLNSFRRFHAKSWTERRRLVEAALLLTLMRAAVFLFSFQRIASWLRLVQRSGPSPTRPINDDVAAEIGRSVVTAAARIPWSTCLTQTLATAAMLRRRSIPSTLYLGIAKDKNGICAHAWIRCGDVILTGAKGHERFAIISSFTVSEYGLMDAASR